MDLTNQEIVDFANTFQALPRGDARFNYVMAKNFRKLRGALREISADTDASPQYAEYAAKRKAGLGSVEELNEKYHDAIQEHTIKIADRGRVLAQQVTVPGLDTVAEDLVPMSDLTPQQLNAIMIFIEES